MDRKKVVFDGREFFVCPHCFSQQHGLDGCHYIAPRRPTFKVIKTFDIDAQTVTLRTDDNVNDFEHFQLLAQEAKYDFPGLKDEEIRIENARGTNYVGMWMIQFHRAEAPSCYESVGAPPQ
jgi:hypothetical protein